MSSPEKTPSVVHCLPNLALGGAQRVVIGLMNALATHGIKPRLVVIGSPETTANWPDLPVEPVYLDCKVSFRDVSGFRRAMHGLRKVLDEADADILHSHLWPAARVGAYAVDPGRTRHVVHLHDTWPWVSEPGLRGRVRRWWIRHMMRRSRAAYVAVARTAWEYHDHHLGLTPCDHRVIFSGVKLDAFCPAQRKNHLGRNGAIRIGMAARFNLAKGHGLLIQAAAELRGRGHNIELRLAGEGSEVGACRGLADALGMEETVHFLGAVSEIPSFLQALDIFALPSLAEGLPISVLEAMAVGLPVVATNVGGTGEIVNDGETGLLIPPNDLPALVRALERLIEDQALRERLSLNGLSRVRRDFSWTVSAQRVSEFYKVISRTPSGTLELPAHSDSRVSSI